ncbi:MAG: alpha/beta hydrolase [Rubripirellula sp.]|nr:alpha/beta hydrolase [Rubripirellula sp.]
MNNTIKFLTCVGMTLASFACLSAEEINLWPDSLPAGSIKFDIQQAEELRAKTTDERIAFVEQPTLSIFPAPKDKATRCAVIICPGGAYNILAWPKEGVEVAEWFNSIGVTAFVLKYRVPRRDPERIHWEPMQDVQRSIRLVRHHAKKWDIDPARIGTLGFSAGGHLTVMSGVQYDTECYAPVDEADKLSCRPNFICPIYCAYLGENYDDRTNSQLGSLVKVTPDTPPTFLAVTWDDAMRGAQSASLFARLRENNVEAEIHVYTKGGHGYGMRPSDFRVSQWPMQLEGWLGARGFLEAK